jgi:hypothetical protein
MGFFSNVLARIRGVDTSPGSQAATEALAVSGSLLSHMRKASDARDPARALMADIWAQRHNVPFMTTMYEAYQEVLTPIEVAKLNEERIAANQNEKQKP